MQDSMALGLLLGAIGCGVAFGLWQENLYAGLFMFAVILTVILYSG